MKLEQNYHSTANIVACALGVSRASRDRVPKELWTAKDRGLPVEIVVAQNERDEAAYVVRTLQEAREAGFDLQQIAVFYRAFTRSRAWPRRARGRAADPVCARTMGPHH